MAQNKIEDLRNHLFAQLERLSDDEDMKDPELLERETKRAKSMMMVASVIVESAKVELDFLKLTGNEVSTFIPLPKQIG